MRPPSIGIVQVEASTPSAPASGQPRPEAMKGSLHARCVRRIFHHGAILPDVSRTIARKLPVEQRFLTLYVQFSAPFFSSLSRQKGPLTACGTSLRRSEGSRGPAAPPLSADIPRGFPGKNRRRGSVERRIRPPPEICRGAAHKEAILKSFDTAPAKGAS
jgi:hypothetical protein